MSSPSSSPTSPIHIVAAGGCHIYGWPISDSHSFLKVMLAEIGSAELTTIAPVNLRHYIPLTTHLQQQSADVLILQLGNYETLASIKKHIRAVLRAKRQSRLVASQSSSCENVKRDTAALDPDTVFQPTAAWRLRVFGKQLYSATVGHLRPLLFDAAKLERSYERLISELLHSPSGAPAFIIVMAPIPCADHLIRRCRLQASEILQRLSNGFSQQFPSRVLFLDSARALGVDARTDLSSAESVFADDLHLNRRGHLALGTALTALIRNHIQDHFAADIPASARKEVSSSTLPLSSSQHPEHRTIRQSA